MKITYSQFWENRWQQGQTGWDLGEISPPLKGYFDQLTDKNLNILIPGCGNAYEAAYLLKNGFTNITVIDLSPTLIESLKATFHQAITTGKLSVVCGDFFNHHAQYDLVVEQTFLCALLPEQRPQYAQHMYELLKPKGKVVGLLFNRDFEEGPPFGGNETEYKTYFVPLFSSIKLEPCYNSAKPRVGSELFITLVK